MEPVCVGDFSSCPCRRMQRERDDSQNKVWGSACDFMSRWYLSRNLFAFLPSENGSEKTIQDAKGL